MNALEHLNEVAHAYQSSILLLSASRTGIFAALDGDELTLGELSGRLDLSQRVLENVLLALVAEGFLEHHGEQYGIVETYRPYLVPDSPETQANILSHNHRCMLSWAQLDKVLHTGEKADVPSSRDDTRSLRDFICGMADISRRSSADVAAKVDFGKYRRLLDVGGGPGTSSITFAQSNPDLRCVVFDLDEVVAIAREEIARAGLEDRVTTVAGDYFRDELGEGFDVVYISNIIHSLGPSDNAMLYEKAWRALEPGGAIIVKDFFLDDSRTKPARGALFSVHMTLRTEAGRSYSYRETEDALRAVGFCEFERIPVATSSGLVVGHKNPRK